MSTWYEVRRERTVEDTDIVYHQSESGGYFAQREFITETCRVDKKAAEQDVDLLGMLGKKCWIVEIER